MIPMYAPDAVDAAVDVLSSFRRVAERHRYVLGPEVAAFEADFAAYCGVGHAIGVGNGTDALELGLRAVGVGPGDEVALVANAGFYGSTAVRSIGALPRYVDVDPVTNTMDSAALEVALARRPLAVIVTHLYGRLADMDPILAVTRAAGVPVVEDCAQAHGAERAGKRAGSLGSVGSFSFYPTKNLGAVGDGGALTTDDPEIAERIRRLRQYGWTDKYGVAVGPGGRNSRLDELQAAVLVDRLPYLDAWNAARSAIARRYADGLTGLPIDPPPSPGPDFVAHLVVIGVDDRARVREHLATAGVGSEVHFPVPDHLQPAWPMEQGPGSLPITERACERVLSLPCFPGLSDADVDRAIAAVRAAVSTGRG